MGRGGFRGGPGSIGSDVLGGGTISDGGVVVGEAALELLDLGDVPLSNDYVKNLASGFTIDLLSNGLPVASGGPIVKGNSVDAGLLPPEDVSTSRLQRPVIRAGGNELKVTTAWTVRERNGSGSNVVISGELDGVNLPFLPLPMFVSPEAALSQPQFREFEIAVTIRITSTGTIPLDSGDVPLPPVTVTAPTVEVPHALTFGRLADFAARDGDYNGLNFLVLPTINRVSDSEAVIAALEELNATLDTIYDFVALVDAATALLPDFNSLITELGRLVRSLRDQPAAPVFADRIDNFEDYRLRERHLIPDVWWWDIDWDNTMSALSFVGTEGAGVKIYNAPDCSTDEGVLRLGINGLEIVPGVKLPLGAAIIPDLKDVKKGSPVPEGSGIGAVAVMEKEPPGERGWGARDVFDFDNDISSLEFT